MKHFFDVEIAKEYGLVAAVLLENINYWIQHNKANKTHCYEGRYWTFNSYPAFQELFPYLSERQIRYSLDKLKNDGIILVGNFNKNKMDRTLWYALTDKGNALFCRMQMTKLSDGSDAIVRPIPYINTYNKQNTSTPHQGVFDFWNNNVHPITPFEADELDSLLAEVGEANLLKAIKIGCSNNKRNLKYITAVARNLLEDDEPKKQDQDTPVLTEEQRKMYESMMRGD